MNRGLIWDILALLFITSLAMMPLPQTVFNPAMQWLNYLAPILFGIALARLTFKKDWPSAPRRHVIIGVVLAVFIFFYLLAAFQWYVSASVEVERRVELLADAYIKSRLGGTNYTATYGETPDLSSYLPQPSPFPMALTSAVMFLAGFELYSYLRGWRFKRSHNA